MTVFELLDLAMSAGMRLDVQWGLFITVHLAIFGGVIYVERPLRLPEKVGALLIYSGFVVLDFRVMRVQLGLMQNAYQDIAGQWANGCCPGSALVEHIADQVTSGRFEFANLILWGGHALMASFVVVAVVFDKALGKKQSAPA